MSTISTNLPELSSDYVVDQATIDSYHENGHCVIRGIMSPDEVAAWEPLVTSTLFEHNDEHRPLEERNTHDKAFLQVWNLWERNEALKPFVFSRRFAMVAGQLEKVDRVRLYHDQALYKEPSGGYTPWHQDQYYWPLATPHSITMWLALVDIPLDMGILTFASGSQKEGFFGHFDISDEGEARFQSLVDEKGFKVTCTALKAGDCTFHSGWSLHKAPPNLTDQMRKVMTIIYYDDGAMIGPADNPGREWDLNRWFPGQKPGEVAGTHLNPLLWTKD